jgi:type VI secretion system protein ImpA
MTAILRPEIDALLKPIPGDNPAGASNAWYGIEPILKEMAKEVDPADFDPNDVLRPKEQKKADWRGIEKETRAALTSKAKDLRLAFYLTLALIKLNRFAGMRDGLCIVRGLIEKCWDFLYPKIDKDENGKEDLNDLVSRTEMMENQLDPPTGGLKLPTALRMIPLVDGEGGKFGVLDWEIAQQPGGQQRAEAFAKALQTAKPELCEKELAAIKECLEEHGRLVKGLEARLQKEAARLQELRKAMEAQGEKAGQFGEPPKLLEMRKALEECQKLANHVLEKVQPARPPEEEKGDKPPGGGGAVAPAKAPVTFTRAEAYRQLGEISKKLRDLEPHSPVPYLIQRAIDLGAMPFPDLLKELVREAKIVADLNRELGIKEPPPAGKK